MSSSLLVRDLQTGDELGIDPDVQLPSASLLTRSTVPAATQPAAESLMSTAARTLHDHLRQR
jgi:hypothetical protein